MTHLTFPQGHPERWFDALSLLTIELTVLDGRLKGAEE